MMYRLKAWKNARVFGIYIGVFAIPLSIISATWRPGVVSFCSAHLAVYNLYCEKWGQWILQVIYDVSSWIETECAFFFFWLWNSTQDFPAISGTILSSVQCDSHLSSFVFPFIKTFLSKDRLTDSKTLSYVRLTGSWSSESFKIITIFITLVKI